jgi:hypothetical protein
MNSINFVFSAYGHENVLATHETTIEITKEKFLTKRGSCIIAVGATKAASDLPFEFKEAARKKDSRITITIRANDLFEVVNAKGSPDLQFTHPTDLVIRKSAYVCGRTLAIKADKSSKDFSREFVEELKDSNQFVEIELLVQNY